MDLTKHIRTVPDFPAPGIMFRDVTTLFAVPEAFSAMISQFKEQWQDSHIDYIAGMMRVASLLEVRWHMTLA